MSSDTWDAMSNWCLVLPPSRPSRRQLALLQKCCEGIDRGASVAVLGSTPEYRDALHEYGFENITVIDRNEAFYKQVSKMRVYKNQEQVIVGDWIDVLSSQSSRFALVLSDLTSGNVPYKLRGELYRTISDVLSDRGIFFDKILTHSGPLEKIKAIEDKYSHLPVNLQSVNYFSCEMLFCSELLNYKEIVDTDFFYAKLSSTIVNERVRRFIEEVKRITPPGCVWWYGRRWQVLEAEYCPSLTRVGQWEEEQGSPYFNRVKYFCFRKNGVR